jgi:hypothetical protein
MATAAPATLDAIRRAVAKCFDRIDDGEGHFMREIPQAKAMYTTSWT